MLTNVRVKSQVKLKINRRSILTVKAYSKFFRVVFLANGKLLYFIMIVNVLETISSGVARTWCSTFAVDLDFEVGLLHGVNVVLSIARSVALVNDGCDQATTYCDVILGRLSFSF